MENNIGKKENEVNDYLQKNKETIQNKLDFMSKIIKRLMDDKFIISDDFKKFKKFFYPYKFIISRLCFFLQNIHIFNRHIKNLMETFQHEIMDKDIMFELNCHNRNSVFQKRLIAKIDDIIHKEYDPSNKDNNRHFSKTDINNKRIEQKHKCNMCDKCLNDSSYESDHIKPWSKGGKSNYDNLQILCVSCHKYEKVTY